MTDIPCRKTHSLWSLSCDGVLWQINPISGAAAPLCSINELSLGEYRVLQREMLERWQTIPVARVLSTTLSKAPDAHEAPLFQQKLVCGF